MRSLGSLRTRTGLPTYASDSVAIVIGIRGFSNQLIFDSTTLVLEEENPINKWDLLVLSSRWDNDCNQEYHDIWPMPPPIPVDGDDMHLPSLDHCGDFPYNGWDFNEPLSSHYHRVLIPSPIGK